MPTQGLPGTPLARSLARDTVMLLAAQLYYRSGGFVVMMVLSRTIAETSLGIYIYALAGAEAFVVVAGFALDRLLMRRVATSPDSAGEVMSTVNGFRLAAAPVYLALVVVFARLTDWQIWPVIFVVALLVLGEQIYISYSCLFLAVDRVDLSIIIGVTVQTAYLAGVVAVMLTTPSLAAFLLVCGLRVIVMISWSLAVSHRRVDRVGVSWDGSLIREALPFAGLALAMLLQDRADVMIVGWFTDYDTVARYGLALRIVLVSAIVPVAIGKLWFPRLSRLGHNREVARFIRRGMAVQFALGTAVMVAVAWLVEPITHLLYGPIASDVAPLLRLLLVLFPVHFLAVFLGLALQAVRAERAVLAVFGLGTAATIALDLLLVPRFGVHAAVAVRVAVGLAQLVPLVWLASRPLSALEDTNHSVTRPGPGVW